MAYQVTADELRRAFEVKEDFVQFMEKSGGLHGLAEILRTDVRNGLSIAEMNDDFSTRESSFGDNTYPEKPRKTWFELWWDAMQDTTIIILCVAALVSLVLGVAVPSSEEEHGGGWAEGLAILLAVLLVTCVTATNEYQQESQFRELNKVNEDKTVKVIRNGAQHQVKISKIFVGDIVVIDCGDQIPADGVVVSADEMTVDESVMTGETDSLHKTPHGDYRMLSGCQCDAGMGKMLVVATGERSQWGLTLKELSDDRQETPLQQTLGDLAEMIGMVGLFVALIVFFVMLVYWGSDLYREDAWEWRNLADVIDFFIIAVTIVVVAVPEGLPLAVTISLAYSMKQMVADNNLVRKLAACETMGGVTDICSDKTGTLTENKMTLEKGWLVGEEFSNVPPNLNATPQVTELIHQCIALNSSPSTQIVVNANGLPPKFIGNKTECALLMFSHLCGFDYQQIRKEHELMKVYAFSSNRKRMSCVIAGHGGFILYCKGAPEMILRDSSNVMRADGQSMPLTPEMRDQLLEYVESMASMGLRTLCLSFRFMPYFNPDVEVDPPEAGLTVLGFVGIRDPIRKEVPEAVRKCQVAGVTVRMVTGDNIITAKKIAEEAGILTEDGVALEGPAFAKMSDEEIDNILPNLQVLARSLPMDKLRLVQRLMANKHVVGVTGDGTNDAPALKQADVGLSMGIAGTDVAKEASDIIILDDNFNSCVFSILWGRCIFDNIRKFLQFQLTVNCSALCVAFIGAVTQRGTPLSVLQLLWVNLIMDTMAALALGTEKPHPDLLERPPININRAWLLSNIMIKNILGQGIFQVVILCFILFAGPYIWYLEDGSNRHYTLIFNSFVFAQVFNEINSRKCNGELNVFDGLFTNWIFFVVLVVTVSLQVLIIEFGSVAFQTAPLNAEEWFITILIGFGSLPLGLILRVIPVPRLDAWGFGEVEQKLRSDTKIKRMRDRYEASKNKRKGRDFERLDEKEMENMA